MTIKDKKLFSLAHHIKLFQIKKAIHFNDANVLKA